MTIPEIKTSGEYWKEEYDRDPQGALLRAMVSDLTGAFRSGLPTYNDQNEVERKAREDFKRHNYGESLDYIDSLVRIADFWKDLAEDYHRALVQNGATFYGTGEVEQSGSFAITRDGKWLVGPSDSFDIADPANHEDAVAALTRWIPTITSDYTLKRAQEVLAELTADTPITEIPGLEGTTEALEGLGVR